MHFKTFQLAEHEYINDKEGRKQPGNLINTLVSQEQRETSCLSPKINGEINKFAKQQMNNDNVFRIDRITIVKTKGMDHSKQHLLHQAYAICIGPFGSFYSTGT